MKTIKSKIALALILLLTGCVTTNKDVSMLIDKKEFMKRHTMSVDVRENCNSLAITLPSVPQVIRLNYKAPDIKTVLYATLKEKKHLNIDKHLLCNCDFYHDYEKEMIHTLLEVPQVYMMKGTTTFLVTITALDQSDRIKTIKNIVTLSWKPKATVKSNETGFRYTSPFSKDILNSEKEKIKASLDNELPKTNTQRLNPEYRDATANYAK